MIPHVHPRGDDAGEALAEALNRPVGNHEGLTADTVVAHWPDLDFFTPADERETWTSADWAAHLNDPNWQHFTVSPQDDRRAIWHADVRLHPEDRALTGPEWSEIAHRLARTAGIHTPGDGHGCRWIAVQARPGHLDLIANLIRPDDRWTRQPHRLEDLLDDECRRLERDLGLTAPATGPGPAQATRASGVHGQHPARSAGVSALNDPAVHQDADGQPGPDAVPTAATWLTGQITGAHQPARLAGLISAVADERVGDLSHVRRFAETAAAWAGARTGHAAGDAEHRLEWIARRLHGIQEDLRGVAQILNEPRAVPRRAARPSPLVRPAAPAPSQRGPVR